MRTVTRDSNPYTEVGTALMPPGEYDPGRDTTDDSKHKSTDWARHVTAARGSRTGDRTFPKHIIIKSEIGSLHEQATSWEPSEEDFGARVRVHRQ